MVSALASQIDRMSANLLRLYIDDTQDCDELAGLDWYPRAHNIMCDWSESYQLPIETVACVTAALSPQLDWERNLILADDVLADRFASIGGVIGENLRKARHIREDKALTTLSYFKAGPKVEAFAHNLAGRWDWVTVDAHASQAALASVTTRTIPRPATYHYFVEAYQWAALRIGLEPAHFQAIIWLTWKRLYPQGVKNHLRRKVS